MPWPHCGNEINDDHPCPSCGLRKQEWTITFDATRKFKVSGRPAVKIELLDASGGYLADEPYKLLLPDEQVLEGKLNPAGYAKGASKIAGMVEVIFPERAGQVRCDHHLVKRAGDSFFCPTGKDKYTFRLAVDVSDQVDTLLRAAATGAAFCEKCEQRRQEQQTQQQSAA
ncbi:MAG: hypothetical protein AB7N76_05065 [Planctomycetota bacterium]